MTVQVHILKEIVIEVYSKHVQTSTNLFKINVVCDNWKRDFFCIYYNCHNFFFFLQILKFKRCTSMRIYDIEQICTALSGSLQDGGNITLRFNNMCQAFIYLNNKRAMSRNFFFSFFFCCKDFLRWMLRLINK